MTAPKTAPATRGRRSSADSDRSLDQWNELRSFGPLTQNTQSAELVDGGGFDPDLREHFLVVLTERWGRRTEPVVDAGEAKRQHWDLMLASEHVILHLEEAARAELWIGDDVAGWNDRARRYSGIGQ